MNRGRKAPFFCKESQTLKRKKTKEIDNKRKCDSLNQKSRIQLETAINRSLSQKEFDAACLLIDRYVKKYEHDLSYEQLCVIANTLCLNSRLEEAFDICMRAMRMDANSPAAPEVLFWIYQNKSDKQALVVIDRLIESGPADRKSTYLYWKAIYANNHALPDLVLACISDAGGPPGPAFEKYQEVTYSLIMALCMLGNIEEAEKIASEVPQELKFKTRYLPMAFAQISQARGCIADSVQIYDEFLAKNPDVPEARWNRALANLAAGNLKQGWRDFECRWDWKGYPSTEKKLSIPKWNGEPLDGKTLLLWAEQGLGDQILFLTLALPLIRDTEIQISIEVDNKLVELVSAWYPEATVSRLENFDCADEKGYERFDYHLPIGSLPRFFLPDIEHLHQRPIRLLRGDLILKKSVLENAKFEDPTLPLVGICWRSSLLNSQRNSGYLNVEAAAKLASELKGRCNFVSLQYAMQDSELSVLAEHSNVFVPEEDFFSDVTSHAKYIGICDLIVTAGTLTSQIAGIFDRNTLTWGIGGWTFLGERQYPWYRNHAAIALEANYDKASLVNQLVRWTRLSLNHNSRSQLD